MDQPSVSPVSPAPVAPASSALVPVSDLIKKSWQYYRAHFKKLISIALVPWLVLFIFGLASGIFFPQGSSPSAATPLLILVGLVVLVIVLVAQFWESVALVFSLSPASENLGVKEIYLGSRPYLARYAWTAILAGVLTIIGLIFLIIPGLILAVWFCAAGYIVVNENISGWPALQASRAYVRGRWWPVFGRLAVMVVIALVLSFIGNIIGSIGGNTGRQILNNVVSLLFAPFAVVYSYHLYQSLRQTR